LPLHRFYELTPRGFYNYLKGVRFRESEIHKAQLENTRLVMWTSLLPHQKKGKKLQPKDVLAFPWEQKGKSDSTLSQEEKNKLAKELWDKVDQKTKA
jgi:hypothetical protein